MNNLIIRLGLLAIVVIGLVVGVNTYASGTVICTQVGTDTYCNYIGD